LLSPCINLLQLILRIGQVSERQEKLGNVVPSDTRGKGWEWSGE
jgi:hypothetical protein